MLIKPNHTPSGKNSDWGAGGNCIPVLSVARWQAILSCQYQTIKQMYLKHILPGGEKTTSAQTFTKRKAIDVKGVVSKGERQRGLDEDFVSLNTKR